MLYYIMLYYVHCWLRIFMFLGFAQCQSFNVAWWRHSSAPVSSQSILCLLHADRTLLYVITSYCVWCVVILIFTAACRRTVDVWQEWRVNERRRLWFHLTVRCCRSCSLRSVEHFLGRRFQWACRTVVTRHPSESPLQRVGLHRPASEGFRVRGWSCRCSWQCGGSVLCSSVYSEQMSPLSKFSIIFTATEAWEQETGKTQTRPCWVNRLLFHWEDDELFNLTNRLQRHQWFSCLHSHIPTYDKDFRWHRWHR